MSIRVDEGSIGASKSPNTISASSSCLVSTMSLISISSLVSSSPSLSPLLSTFVLGSCIVGVNGDDV